MKKIRVFVSVLIMLIILATPVLSAAALTAEAEPRVTRWHAAPSEWLASTQMIDWRNYEVIVRVDRWLKEAGAETDDEKSRALYDIVLKAGYNSDVFQQEVEWEGELIRLALLPATAQAFFLEEKSFMTCFREMIAYLDEGGPRPLWFCGDYSRFHVGLLRAAGISAAVSVGRTSGGVLHARVMEARLMSEGNASWALIYYSDPTFGSTTGLSDKFFHMTQEVFSLGGISSSRTFTETRRVFELE
jgi:hypothetical protein